MPAPAQTYRIQDLLTLAEKRSQVLSQALLAGEPDQVAVASAEVQQVVQALSDSLQQAHQRATLDRSSAVRLQQLGQDMLLQREACLRHLGVVDRSLHSLLPSTRTSTYGGANTPYGQQARRSGAFKLIAA